MAIYLEILEGFSSQTDSLALERAAETTCRYQSIPETSELSIVITDNQHIHELNQQFRNVDAPTDVLSFPAEFTDPESGAPYLGDVIISFPKAEAQATAGGHSVSAELQLLVVHGILHLLGHDHAEPEEKEKMWKAQSEILDQLGIEEMF